MGKTVVLLWGNGVTLDFTHHTGINSAVDARNLFRFGAHVPWPANGEPGFLSFKRCPNLWNLGARPTMDAADAMSLIEDIITCVNVYALSPPTARSGITKSNDIYIYAYKELVKYLKHLFVYYDAKFPSLPENATEWTWIEFIKSLHDREDISEIKIITYNYDVWLERLLMQLELPFNMNLFSSQPDAKISILKPHGSISFCHKDELDHSSFEIRKDFDLADGVLDDFIVRYDHLDRHTLVDALIPPAGEAGRYANTWAGQIRLQALAWLKRLRGGDHLVIGGLSYWHVDRPELDELLVQCSRDVDVKMVNPSPPRSMNAVLTSLFESYVLHGTAEVLLESVK